jgi:hypothetical protein
MAVEPAKAGPGSFARHGWAGLALISIFWPLNWFLPGLRTAYLFFPLWLGYILAVDALVLKRTGTSLYTRSGRAFVFFFAASAPGWWLFELINARTRNWEYQGAEAFSQLEYFLLATLAFSTVMPAVFVSAELVRSFGWVERLGRGRPLRVTARGEAGLFLVGAAMLTLTLLWPRYCYPFVWTSIALMLEPINRRLGRRHLLLFLQEGNWRPLLCLALGSLLCGFFWEMWNYYSYPRWVYHTPGVEFLHVFEMPLLGFGGYIPFAFELYGLKQLLWPRSPDLRIA